MSDIFFIGCLALLACAYIGFLAALYRRILISSPHAAPHAPAGDTDDDRWWQRQW